MTELVWVTKAATIHAGFKDFYLPLIIIIVKHLKKPNVDTIIFSLYGMEVGIQTKQNSINVFKTFLVKAHPKSIKLRKIFQVGELWEDPVSHLE